MSRILPIKDLKSLATYLRKKLKEKNPNNAQQLKYKYMLLYAYNGTGKTRLSVEFKNAGKRGGQGDTLYFNAFTEDLFTWDNDLDGDSKRVLKFNAASRFFAGIKELEMENRIRPFLNRYADFDFRIDYDESAVSFSRTFTIKPDDGGEEISQTIDNIKVSRGEENIFIWCFFLAIVQLAIDGADAYKWAKYIYIDDPISSLDDNNAIAVATDLTRLLRREENHLQTVISSHHTLFFNVLWNELSSSSKRLFLGANKATNRYYLRNTDDTPYFHHVATLVELQKAAQSGKIYTYHFNMLRGILEKTASFHGFRHFSACVRKDDDDIEGIIHSRLINLMSHGNYSLYEPQEMVEDNKEYFKKILSDFMGRYAFNEELFSEPTEVDEANFDRRR
ncbi:AAA family ATPase [Candidatus Chloroploca sp. M-50]|uniref:AAA family ATPase n=1 Tax=Candidatus Chloroploca mongolica TaxID=2528176 RepID=A0ABS4DAH6_9CHLR|nr:AAA family ATPase [Candidatus Chloroploca mongolica]MBP1466461.1 AAA family ATPase [Candidatus Chloroploca mongolica]